MPLESGARCAAVDNIGDDWHNPMLQNRGFVTEATAPAQFHVDELMEKGRPRELCREHDVWFSVELFARGLCAAASPRVPGAF